MKGSRASEMRASTQAPRREPPFLHPQTQRCGLKPRCFVFGLFSLAYYFCFDSTLVGIFSKKKSSANYQLELQHEISTHRHSTTFRDSSALPTILLFTMTPTNTENVNRRTIVHSFAPSALVKCSRVFTSRRGDLPTVPHITQITPLANTGVNEQQ